MSQVLSPLSAVIMFVVILAGCASQPEQPSPEIQSLITRAQSGDVKAQFQLANAYDYGRGVRRNGSEAEKWYRMAAEGGLAESQNSLGSLYQAEKRYKDALTWYEKAAMQDHALATNNLGYLYDLGLGVPQDRQKGYELYLRSAELGWAEAMFNIGQMYGAGQLGQPDLVKGCMWTLRALKYSEGGKVKDRSTATANYCREKLSNADYRKAEQESNSWSPKSAKK